MPAISEPARAKINLTLRVLGRRADGYHEIESLVAFADAVADRISIAPGTPPAVATEGPFATEIAGENLIEAALREAAAAEPSLILGAVTLAKHIPVAGGLGGGSADAAALLRALRRINPGVEDKVDWPAIAARLGADVPACLADRPAIVRGIGERVSPVPTLPALHAVLVNPMAHVLVDKTARVFQTLSAAALPRDGDTTEAQPVPDFGGDGEALVAYVQDTGNDLTTAARAVMPEIDAVLAAIERTPGCLGARMSGAGPTCFGLFASEPAAAAAPAALTQAQPRWWVRATRLS